MNWLFWENAQLRKDYLRLKQKFSYEIGNKDMLMLLSLKPIENSNLRDWSFVSCITGQIRLKEKGLIYLVEMRKRIFQDNR